MDCQRIRLYTKSFGVLGPVRQIASNKTVSVSSDPVSFQLDQQCAMVNCVEGLTKVYKYTKYMFFCLMESAMIFTEWLTAWLVE